MNNKQQKGGEDISKKMAIIIKARKYKIKQKRISDEQVDVTVSDPRSRGKILIREITEPERKSGTIGVKEIGKVEQLLEQEDFEKAILIGEKFSRGAGHIARKNNIEVFSKNSIPSFDLFTHRLVPKHELLLPGEAQIILEEYGGDHILPLIRSSDPAARLIGAEPGDVIKIDRKSPTAERITHYRYVVE